MATSALPTPDIGAPRLGWARLLALVPFAVVVATAIVELGLADRKFGLFTGGFGVSRTVDTLTERALFAGGYGAAMALLGLAGWWLAHQLTRGRPGWAPVFVFAILNGALFAGILAAQYRLAAYFSDARQEARVDVHVTRRKHVRPAKGGPGRVHVHHSDTMRVAPRDPAGRLRRR